MSENLDSSNSFTAQIIGLNNIAAINIYLNNFAFRNITDNYRILIIPKIANSIICRYSPLLSAVIIRKTL